MAALALPELIGSAGPAPAVVVDRRLASLWFAWSIRPLGWEVPPPWDPIAGDHRAAALAVLGCGAECAALGAAAAAWDG